MISAKLLEAIFDESLEDRDAQPQELSTGLIREWVTAEELLSGVNCQTYTGGKLPTTWVDGDIDFASLAAGVNNIVTDRIAAQPPLVVNWERFREKLSDELTKEEELLWECARELEYVQCVENCHSGLCATSLGKSLVQRAVTLLGVDFYCDTYQEAKRRGKS